MIKILIALFIGTLLFAQTDNKEIIKRHPLEIGNWITKEDMSKSDKFLKRHIDKTLVILAKNPNLDNASEADIWKHFLSTKTSKFIAEYKQLQPTYY